MSFQDVVSSPTATPTSVCIIVNGLMTGAKLRRIVEMDKEKRRKKKIICRKIPKYLATKYKMLIFAASEMTNPVFSAWE